MKGVVTQKGIIAGDAHSSFPIPDTDTRTRAWVSSNTNTDQIYYQF